MNEPGREPALGPLQDLVDLLARRHALGLVWRLRGGPQPFGVLVAALDVPGPQVAQRLHELREGGIVEVDESGDYRLAGAGRRLLGALEPLADAAARWAALTPHQRVPRGAPARGRGEPGGV